MDDLKDILGGVERVTQQAQEQVRQTNEEAKRELLEAREALLRGEEGTGSTLHDNLILMYGDWLIDGEIVRQYETVDTALKGKIGEPVMLVKRWIEDTSHGGPGHRPRQAISHALVVGLVCGEEIIFDDERTAAFLPTERYIITSYRYHHGVMETKEGNLLIDKKHSFMELDFQLGLNLGRQLDLEHANLQIQPEPEEQYALELAVGYDAIQEWLGATGDYSSSKNGLMNDIRKMCEKLGIEEVEPVTKAQKVYLGRS